MMNKNEYTQPPKKKSSNKSIKQEISIWYFWIYLFVSILAVITISLSLLLVTYKESYNVNDSINNKVASIVKSNNFYNVNKMNEKLLKTEKKYNSINIALVNSKGEYYLMCQNEDLNNYVKTLKDNKLFQIIPKASLLNKGYIVSSRDIVKGKNIYKLLIFHEAGTLFDRLKYILPPISLLLFLGSIFTLILGRMKLGKIFAPINQMTKTTRKITAENLDIRLDVSSAEYELKELAKTTNEMIDSFQDSYERQEQFVSDVSHELRTPISVVSGYANMLKRWGKEDEEILEESVDSILFETKNMTDLVNRLLFLVKHDRKNLKYNFEIINISSVIIASLKDIAVTHPEFKVNDDVTKNLYVKADEFRIMEVIRIFLDNAIKYSNNKKELGITLKKEEKNVILSIKDSGFGIKEEDLKNIFNRFYRSDKSRNKETGGMGLGLSIAKVIILDHNGQIRVKTKENEGSTFEIILPLVDINTIKNGEI